MNAPVAPRVLFLGVTYVGHKTRFTNLRRHAEADPRINAVFREVRGWREDGAVERIGVLPRRVRSAVRTLAECAPFATLPRPDVVWTSAAESIAPYLLAQVGPLRRPVIFDIDWTLEQQETLAGAYYGRRAHSGVGLALRKLRRAIVHEQVAMFTTWSEWAARSLREHGVAESRIRVIPPGVDLDRWAPAQRGAPDPMEPLRLLFVGGDFNRKGGPLLLRIAEQLGQRCTLDIVTTGPVPESPTVRVHRAQANSPELRRLYARADVFVLPTTAETFGIATVEAMASGLPVIVSDVGAAREIVEDGVTGWLTAPEDRAVRDAIERAIANRSALRAMGDRGAQRAAERFDGQRNDSRIVELALELAAGSSGLGVASRGRSSRPAPRPSEGQSA